MKNLSLISFILFVGLQQLQSFDVTAASLPIDLALDCGAVFLTVSSLSTTDVADPDKDDKLELNWDFRKCALPSDRPDRVALFNKDPISSRLTPLESVLVADRHWNFHVTKISLGAVKLPGGWLKQLSANANNLTLPVGAICLPFWIASFKNDKLITSNCLKIQPTWMADARSEIGKVPLSRLALPGTHNAGAFSFSDSDVDRDADRTVLQRFSLCQDRDIWNQLVFGIRYLDFRIAYYKGIGDTDRKFWVNHNFIQIARLLPMLRDIKKFLDSTTDEIVVLDIHQLPVGFYESNKTIIVERHKELLALLKKELGDHISEFGRTIGDTREIVGPTVSAIVKSGKRLIIGYPERSVTDMNKWLWPNVKHMWGNTNDAHKLKSYLDAVMRDPYRPTAPGSNPLWSAMAQTTPTALEIATSGSSLRNNANAINRNLTSWLRYDWTSRANVVSSDFFLGNDAIDASIYLNKIKGGP